FIFDGYKVDLFRAMDRTDYITDHFAKISAKLGYQVLPPERMVDQLAQISMSRDSTKALAIYRLNTQLYPKSPRAFNVLGNALLARRDSTAARAAFEQALALAPGNTRARDMVQKLKAGKQ